jgi:hypothetical protein
MRVKNKKGWDHRSWVGDKVKKGNCGWGNVLSRQQGEVTGEGHAVRTCVHERVGLQVEILKHFVGAPSADKTDDVGIDTGAEEEHGTTGSKTAGGDAKRIYAKLEVEGSGAVAKHGGNAHGNDGVCGGGAKKIEVERSSGRGVVLTEMDNATHHSEDRAGEGMAGAGGVTNLFALNCIFLISENQTGKIGVVDVVKRCHRSIEDMTANGQFDVAEVEGRTEGVRSGGFGVITWTV